MAINIKPSHRGRFTAWAKANGFASASAAASAVTSNPGKYSTAVQKMARFAQNAKSFRHSRPALSKLARI